MFKPNDPINLDIMTGNRNQLGDPLAIGAGGDVVVPQDAQEQIDLTQIMTQPFTATAAPMLQPPTMSQKLVNAGMAMIAADQAGLGLGGSLAAGMKGYSDTLEAYRQDARKERQQQLAEYELLGRIRERQNAELARVKREEAIDELAKRNPQLADLLALNPDMAASVIADRMKPRERKIVEQGGVQYYADTGEPVLKGVNAPRPKPFEGTGMDAQVMNTLLTGDPSSPEYMAAFNYMGQEKILPDGTRITPDMSAFEMPISPAAAAPLGVPAGGAVPPAALPAVFEGLPAGTDTGGMLQTPIPADPLAPPPMPAAPTLSDPLAMPQRRMGAKGGVTPSATKASVQGYDIADGASPTIEDAKAVKEISEAHRNIGTLMKQREEIIKNNPNPVVGSAEAMKLDQNTNQLALKIKSLEQTGALDQGSVDVMMKAIGDPVIRGTSLKNPVVSTRESLTKKYGGKGLSEELTRSGKQYIDQTLESAVTARGYKPKKDSANTENIDLKAKYGLK